MKRVMLSLILVLVGTVALTTMAAADESQAMSTDVWRRVEWVTANHMRDKDGGFFVAARLNDPEDKFVVFWTYDTTVAVLRDLCRNQGVGEAARVPVPGDDLFSRLDSIAISHLRERMMFRADLALTTPSQKMTITANYEEARTLLLGVCGMLP